MVTLLIAAALGPVAFNKNLVVNEDFSKGAVGFRSDYRREGELSDTGTYAITTDPHLVHAGGFSMSDHTGNHGNMLVANAAEDSTKAVWEETIAVQPGQSYVFSLWGASWGMDTNGQDPSPARLVVLINGKSLGPAQQLIQADEHWSKLTRYWKSGKATSATIRIVDENTEGFGNDFAIDDISFHRQ